MAENKTKETKEKMVKIRLPRDRHNANATLFVGVNEREFLIKRGEEVEVPECVAEVIRNSEEMEDYAYAYAEGLAQK